MKLKEIAAQLRAAANSYPEAITPATFQDAAMQKAHDENVAAQREHRVEFRFGTLVIRCTEQAVLVRGVAEAA